MHLLSGTLLLQADYELEYMIPSFWIKTIWEFLAEMAATIQGPFWVPPLQHVNDRHLGDLWHEMGWTGAALVMLRDIAHTMKVTTLVDIADITGTRLADGITAMHNNRTSCYRIWKQPHLEPNKAEWKRACEAMSAYLHQHPLKGWLTDHRTASQFFP